MDKTPILVYHIDITKQQQLSQGRRKEGQTRVKQDVVKDAEAQVTTKPLTAEVATYKKRRF